MSLQADNTNDFSLQIVKQLLLEEGKNGFQTNLACSPLSITILLNMLATGSKGHDLEQFLSFLGSKSIDELNAKSLKLITSASNKDSSDSEGPSLICVNGAWVDQRCIFKPSFEEVAKSIYEVEAKVVDFQNKGREAKVIVNSWAENATRGLIKELISGSIDTSKQLILANALYFKGAWECPFDETMSEDRTFYLHNGETIQVPFMYKYYEDNLYGSFEGFKLVKLPYRNGKDERRFSMYIFLPDERDGLQKLINNFDSDPGFLNQQFMLKKRTINHLMIPKFRFSYGTYVSDKMLDLGFFLPCLDSMEIIEMVESQSSESLGGTLVILHKACIEVNEEGTEAAAITEADDMGFSLDGDPPPQLNFIADHPFMFMIREETSQIPFFIGAIVKPLWVQ